MMFLFGMECKKIAKSILYWVLVLVLLAVVFFNMSLLWKENFSVPILRIRFSISRQAAAMRMSAKVPLMRRWNTL